MIRAAMEPTHGPKTTSQRQHWKQSRCADDVTVVSLPGRTCLSWTRGVRWKRRMVMCLVPSLLSLCVYWNSLDGEFVHDDLSAITTNHDVIGPTSTWDFLYNDFWGTDLLDPRSHKSYRPLTVLTFKWNYAVSGLNPWSYHAVNILLHSLVSCLLAWICHNCLGLSTLGSLLTASLFAIHPIHTEAVSGIVGRADLLTTLFFLLSFVAHDRSVNNALNTGNSSWQCSKWTLISLLLALLALAAKENGIAALPVAISWKIIRFSSQQAKSHSHQGGRNNWIRVPRALRNVIIISLITTVLLLLARLLMLRGQLPAFSEQDNPAAFASNRKARILTLLYLPVVNMGLLLAPIHLSYDYTNGSIPLIEHFADWRNGASLLFYTALIGTVAYAWIRRKRVVLWSVSVMILPMLPASNLFYPVGFVVAERLLYLPSLGYCLVVGQGFRFLLDAGRRINQPISAGNGAKLKRTSSASSTTSSTTPSPWSGPVIYCSLVMLMAGVLAASFTVKTWTRNAEWINRQTLFASGLRVLPNNAKMHYNYANLLKDESKLQSSIFHYRQAIKLWPTYASAHNNLGTVLLARAEEDDETADNVKNQKESLVVEAEQHFWLAIRSHPHHVHAHYNLAILSLQRNDSDQALHLLKRCLHFNPNHREALNVMRWLLDDSTKSTEQNVGSTDGSKANYGSSSGTGSSSFTRYVNSYFHQRQQQQQQQGSNNGKGYLSLSPSPSKREYRWNETAKN